jgi:hypothetical protein
MATTRLRATDISGIGFPEPDAGGSTGASVLLTIRPPQFEPPEDSTEFMLAFSTQVPGGGALTALFTLDATPQQNVVVPSCAFQLPPNAVARINAVSIGGDTGAVAGAPTLIFSIRSDRTGQVPLPGWAGIGLPGRGGVVTVGFEPFTRVTQTASFFGGFVRNLTGGPLYGEMIITGWYWIQP